MDFEENYPRHIYQNCLRVQQHVLSYLQKVCVSICSSLGPVLATIIVTQVEDVIIKPLIADATIKFYRRFLDDTLLIMKHKHIDKVTNLLTTFILQLISSKMKYLMEL